MVFQNGIVDKGDSRCYIGKVFLERFGRGEARINLTASQRASRPAAEGPKESARIYGPGLGFFTAKGLRDAFLLMGRV